MSINTLLAFGDQNIKIVLLFDPSFKNNMGLCELATNGINKSRKSRSIIIDCREGSELTLKYNKVTVERYRIIF